MNPARPEIVLGIDPGQKGALVALRGSAPVLAEPMPATARVGLDLGAVRDLLEQLRPGFTVVERAQAMPEQGSASIASYLRDYGGLLGLLVALRLPHTTVHPATWHRRLVGPRPKGEPAGNAKARALAVVRQRVPTLDLVPGRRRKPDEGLVDACCLALWGQGHLWTPTTSNG